MKIGKKNFPNNSSNKYLQKKKQQQRRQQHPIKAKQLEISVTFSLSIYLSYFLSLVNWRRILSHWEKKDYQK